MHSLVIFYNMKNKKVPIKVLRKSIRLTAHSDADDTGDAVQETAGFCI